MQTIATFGDTVEAHLAKGRLENAGIPSFLADEQTVGVAWHLTVALGGVKLQVAEENADEARAVLAERPAAEESEPTSPPSLAPDESTSPTLNYQAAIVGEEAELSDRERTADRAWRGSVVGLFFWPIEFYIAWLLIKVFVSNERLAQPHRRRAMLATVFSVPVVVVALTGVGAWIGF